MTQADDVQPDHEDIFEVLDSDHRALLELTADATAADDAESLSSACEQLVMAVVRHFVAEEQYLLPLVRKHVDDGEHASKLAFDEHRAVEDELRRLEDLEHDPPAARSILDDVSAALHRHVAGQHDELFPTLRARCDEEFLRELAGEILGSEQLAPTRPRMVRPESAAVNKMVSLVAGYVDQVRDHYGRRGVTVDHAGDEPSA